jgi:hypothetical protein
LLSAEEEEEEEGEEEVVVVVLGVCVCVCVCVLVTSSVPLVLPVAEAREERRWGRRVCTCVCKS